jgi:hypothetical protein
VVLVLLQALPVLLQVVEVLAVHGEARNNPATALLHMYLHLFAALPI